MNPIRVSKFGIVAALVALGATLSFGSLAAVAEEVEVLTRGPVHEAFAETVAFNPQPGVVVMRDCPAPIVELPPELKPEGANVTWIPGYWAWDDERNDFLWVSGIWRDLPTDANGCRVIGASVTRATGGRPGTGLTLW